MTTTDARGAATDEPGGTDQTLRNRVREQVKLAVRGVLHRADLDVSRGPYPSRLARALRAHRLDTVLDVGANVGQFATMLRRAGYDGRIVSFEPLSGAYGELAKRAARDPRWEGVRTAVGAEPGETTIHVSANSFSSSVLEMTEAHRSSAPGSAYVSSETVPVTTVADIVTAHGVDPERSLLKIDTQGFEHAVLAGAGDLVGRFAALQLELSFVELYEGQQLFDELYERLRGAGYRIHVLDPGFSDAADGRLMQCDGLFLRADLGVPGSAS